MKNRETKIMEEKYSLDYDDYYDYYDYDYDYYDYEVEEPISYKYDDSWDIDVSNYKIGYRERGIPAFKHCNQKNLYRKIDMMSIYDTETRRDKIIDLIINSSDDVISN